MQIILTNEEIKEILRKYVAETFGVKVIDISSYAPYTFEVSPLETRNKNTRE